MKKSLPVMILTLLVLLAAALAAPRQAAARQALPTPPPAGVRLLPAAPGEAGPAQRLVYAETAPGSQQSTLYLAPADDPGRKQALAEITHRAGYPPKGQVSPDGQWIAVLTVPPGSSEASARTRGGELWLVAADGSAAQRAASDVTALSGWSADGAWLAYARLAPIPTPSNPQVPFRTEVYRLRADGLESSLVFSNAVDYGVQPLGWLPDGSYLAALLDMRGEWRLAAFSGGAQARGWEIPRFDLVRKMSLSPQGSEVLVEAVNGGQDELVVLHLEGGLLQAQPALAAAPITDTLPVSPVQGIWSAQGHLWILRQPRPGSPLQAETTGPQLPPAQPRLDLAQSEFLLPESWSPDENWFLYRRYPQIYTRVYLQPRGSSELVAIQPDRPDNWLTLFGWIPAGEAR